MKRLHLGRALLLGSALVLLGAPARAQECLDCHGQPGSSVSFKDGSSEGHHDRPRRVGGLRPRLDGRELHRLPHRAHGVPAPRAEGGLGARVHALALHLVRAVPRGPVQEAARRRPHQGDRRRATRTPPSAPTATTRTRRRRSPARTGSSCREGRVGIPQTCARCHGEIQTKYRESVHGAALVDGNPDVPTCIDCHGVHDIPDPRTAAFRLASPRMCADCHTDAKKMAKYKLSTQVLRTYVADFHGSTVTLFQRRHPDQVTNKPVCYDCHGIHDIASKSDPKKGLQVKANLLQTCQKCHPDATANFPDAWLSHYIPTPRPHPPRLLVAPRLPDPDSRRRGRHGPLRRERLPAAAHRPAAPLERRHRVRARMSSPEVTFELPRRPTTASPSPTASSTR